MSLRSKGKLDGPTRNSAGRNIDIPKDHCVREGREASESRTSFRAVPPFRNPGPRGRHGGKW